MHICPTGLSVTRRVPEREGRLPAGGVEACVHQSIHHLETQPRVEGGKATLLQE